MTEEDKVRMRDQLFERGRNIETGKGTGKPDPAGAIMWYENAAKLGSVDAMINLGAIHSSRNEHEKAYQWVLEAALAGNRRAWYDLGIIYFYGWYVNQDYTKAYEYFLKAYEAGEYLSCYFLGRYAEKGFIGTPNLERRFPITGKEPGGVTVPAR